MNDRERRIGENEAIFRALNEEVRGLTATFTTPAEAMRIVCECGTRSCTEQFAIRPDEYANVRDDPTLFVLKPGHELPETEHVVDRREGYWIVRKDPGLPAELARATDPTS
jgi:hypothetical protein